jgi:ParB-like chromosome segregation protein Spo0J
VHVATLPLDQIAIRDRTRREMRNIDSLARSIRDRGLLQPVVVRPDGSGYALVAGGRRIEALRSLNETTVAAHIAECLADELEALLAEGEENTEREKFTPTEAVEHAERIRAVEEQRAADRRREAARRAAAESARSRAAGAPTAAVPLFVEPAPAVEPSGKFPEGSEQNTPPTSADRSQGETRNRIAKATGMSGRTLEKARHVVHATQDPEAPLAVREAAREAQAVMDRTGKVDPAFKKVREAEVEALTAPVRSQLEASGAAEEIRRKQWQANFHRELAKAFGLIGMYRPEQVAAGASEAQLKELRDLAESVADYVARIEALRERPQGLSLVVGG